MFEYITTEYSNNDYDHNTYNDFDMAIEINPQYEKAYNNRGNAYLDLLDYSSAIRDFDMAIEINPQFEKSIFQQRNCLF